jgi:septal ring factor EnvC (AmiA/AmiB activator)
MLSKVLFLFIYTSSASVLQQAEDVARKLQKDKALVVQKEQKQREILSGLFEISQKIKKLTKEKSELESEKRLLDFSIENLKEKNTQLTEGLKTKGRELIGHVRWLQQAKEFSWLNAVSDSKGPAEADLNFYILSKLSEREKIRIHDYFLEKKQLKKNEEKLQLRLSRWNDVSRELKEKERESLQKQTQRKTALSQIQDQKHQVLKRIKDLRSTKLVQKLEDTGLLDGLVGASFVEGKGSLGYPVVGDVKQRFGIVKAADSSYYKNHKGIFIQARGNPAVHAVFEGKVAFVGTIGGFGKTLILDHGDHYYTVYSSLSFIDVMEGQQIGKHQPVGKVGASSFYKDAGVYFEIRHFSEPQDPQDWVKKGSL